MEFKIRLRAITTSDIDKTLQWHNDKDIKLYYSSHPFPVNIEMEKLWLDNVTKSNIPTTVFAIEEVSLSELVGLSVLKNIDFIHRSAEFGIYIGEPSMRGKGYAKLATIQTINFAFNKMGLIRLYLKVLVNNYQAVGLYKSCGFVVEGTLRKSVFKDNDFHNELIMSILSDEYQNIHRT
jgi:RimJ/RimL family protein N-acetyltransferase